MDNFILELSYYNDYKLLSHSNKATPNEKVASHVDHLKSIFRSNILGIKNTLNNKFYCFDIKDLYKNYEYTLGQLINLTGKK